MRIFLYFEIKLINNINMKKVLLFSFIFFSLFSVKAEMLDVDYNFIDTAFDGIKPVSDKQFNDVINKMTPQPVEDTFGGKLKAFLFGRKYGPAPTNTQNQDVDVDFGGEKKAIEDLNNGVHYITLYVSIVAQDDSIIPVGNYKIQEKIINNEPMLVFYQGHKEYGMLKLKTYEDNLKKEYDLNYSRIDVIDETVIRIVYSTISDTKCAYAKVH